MIAEIFAVIGVLTAIVIVYGTYAKIPALCLFGFMLLLIFGLYTYSDGVTFKIGETKASSSLANTTDNQTVIAANETTVFSYAAPSQVGGFDFNQILGSFLLLCGLFGTISYSVQLSE